MALTPNEILNKEFDTKFRGYDTDQVNDYLDIIVAEYEQLIQKNNQLQQELGTAKEKNEYFNQLQESLNSSIVVAQEAADRLKQNARKEAELILYEASREADGRVNEANDHAQSIITETEALRRNSQNYREKLESMIRNQLDLVTNEEYTKLFSAEVHSEYQQPNHDDLSQRTANKVDQLTEEAETETTEPSTTENSVDIAETRQVETNDLEFVSSDSDTSKTNTESIRVSDEEIDHTESIQSDKTKSEDTEDIKRTEKPTESVLGQTIRIELPTDDD